MIAVRWLALPLVSSSPTLAVCPAKSAWDLHRAWPEADLRIVLAGHSAREPNIERELIKATDGFRKLDATAGRGA